MIAWQIIGCILIADFFTGLFHWLQDNLWPLGLSIRHHEDPHNDFLRRAADRFFLKYRLGMLAVFTILEIIFFGLCWQTILISVLLSVSPIIHGWSHGKRHHDPVVRFFQSMALLQTSAQHMGHHRVPYSRSYCTLTNWVNPILNLIRFWNFMDFIKASITKKGKS